MRKFKPGDKVKSNSTVLSGTVVNPYLLNPQMKEKYDSFNASDDFYIIFPDDPELQKRGGVFGTWGYSERDLTLLISTPKEAAAVFGCPHIQTKDVWIGPMIGIIKVCLDCKQEIK